MSAFRAKPPKGALLKHAHPLATGLVAAWIFNDHSGPTTHDSAGSNPGSVNGALTWQSDLFGDALAGFAGGSSTTTFVDVGNSSLLNPTGPQSYVMLVTPTAYRVANPPEHWILARDTDTGRSYTAGLMSSNGATAVPFLQINGTNVIASGTTIGLNAPILLAFTGDGTNWNAYVNGQLSSTAAWLAPASTTINTNIGRRGYPSNQYGFQGTIHGVWFYGTALTAKQIQLFAADPYCMFRRRRLPVPIHARAAGGGVTVGLTGTAATASTGSLTPALAVNLTGQAATGATGTFTPSLALALSGSATTSAAGTVSPTLAVTLSGQTATGATGTVSPALAVSLSGSQATGTTGVVGVQGDVTVALTGTAATTAAGTLAPALAVGVPGQAATSAAGTLAAALALALSGSIATGSMGTVTPSGGNVVVPPSLPTVTLDYWTTQTAATLDYWTTQPTQTLEVP